MRIAPIGAWGRRSHEQALDNAREAATTLSRARVERDEVELYVRSRSSRSAPDTVRRPA